ncbi:MAG TPA: excisionase [Xanthobacteraceae bacterium]|nr:excisionase [Xanthobacteraceae bacterium]
MADAETIGPDTPIRLETAARLAFPDGSISAGSLRREGRRGRLIVWRIAGKDMTSLAEIEAMKRLCRLPAKPQDSGCGQPESAETRAPKPQPGSSSTEANKLPLAAARARIRKLSQRSSDTSKKSTRRRGENVISIGSRSQT